MSRLLTKFYMLPSALVGLINIIRGEDILGCLWLINSSILLILNELEKRRLQ